MTEGPSGLQSMGLQKVGHDFVTKHAQIIATSQEKFSALLIKIVCLGLEKTVWTNLLVFVDKRNRLVCITAFSFINNSSRLCIGFLIPHMKVDEAVLSELLDMSLRKLQEIGKDREAWQFTGVTKSRHDLDARTIPTRIISNLIYKTTNL